MGEKGLQMAMGAGGGKAAGEMSEAGVRALKIAIVVMGIMIVAGLLTVVGRIFYLADKSRRSPVVAGALAGTSGLPLAGRISAELPQGANVRTMSLAGDRLAVYYDGPSGGGILVIDLVSGQVASRIDMGPLPPRNN